MAIQTRISGALRALAGSGTKSNIWGSDWRSFMGIGSGNDVGEVGDSPSEWLGARTSESYIYRCVDVRGNAIAQVPLRVWEVDKAGKRRTIDHPALEVLDQSNALSWVDGIPTLARYTLMSLDLQGRSAWQLAFNARKVPTEIYWLPPSSIKPVHGYEVGRPELPFAGVKYTTAGGIKPLGPDEIVYFATPNPQDPIAGTSKIQVLRRAINLRAYSQDANLKFFKNSMLPPWVLTTEKNLTEEAHERILRNLRRWVSGANNQTPLIVGGGTDAKVLAMSHEDAKWIQQQALAQEEISATFGVPLVYLNNYDRATYDNITTAKLIFWHDTMIPDGDEFSGLLTRRFLRKFWPDARQRGYEFGFDYNAIEGLGEDVARIWERFTTFMKVLDEQVNHRELTPNQARVALAQMAEELGLDSSPWQGDVMGGDTFYLPYANIPVDQLDAQMIIDVNAARGTNPQLEIDVPGAPDVAERAELPDPSHPVPAGTVGALTQEQAQAEVAKLNEEEKEERDAAGHPVHRRGLDLDDIRQVLRDELADLRIAKATDMGALMEARLSPIRGKLERKLKRWFQGLQLESLRNLRKGAKAVTVVPDAETLYDHGAAIDELLAMLEESYGEAASAAYEASAKDYSLAVAWDAQNPWLEQFVGQRMHLIKGIDETTVEQLKAAIQQGLDNGDDMQQLADAVAHVFQEAIGYRAARIARTEVMQAYGMASIRSYADAGIEQAQMYDGPHADSADCIDVNGMVVSLAEAATLMGMEHPNGVRSVSPVVDLGLGTQTRSLPLRKERAPETEQRPPQHNHEGMQDTPVIVTDLHGTLAPVSGYPLDGAQPFEGVKRFLDEMAAAGCCIHIATASLGGNDPEIDAAREAMARAWCDQHGLPIGFIGPKVPAHVYLDDRAVEVGKKPDWLAIADAVKSKLAETFELGDDGRYQRRQDLEPEGDKIEDYPDLTDVPPDQPRGFSTPILDIDIHRTINPGWGSTREAEPDPEGVAFIRSLYDAGYQIHLSCAGWNPATHSPQKVADRLASQRLYMRRHGIPYDRMVAKDDSDIYLDNLAVPFTTWDEVAPAIEEALASKKS